MVDIALFSRQVDIAPLFGRWLTLAATPASLTSVWNVMRTLIKGGDLSLVITVRSGCECVSRRFLGEGCGTNAWLEVQGVEKYGFIHSRPCVPNCAYVIQLSPLPSKMSLEF